MHRDTLEFMGGRETIACIGLIYFGERATRDMARR